MDGLELQRVAQTCAEKLPGATLGYPFGADWDVFKVAGKVFMLMTEVSGEPVVILKASPGDAETLRLSFREIRPGYHMNKKHWITLIGGPAVDSALVRELVTESFRLVVARLPRRLQPADPPS